MTNLEELKASLDVSKEMLDLLNNRIAFLRADSQKTEYQANEDKITILKTKGEIFTLRSIINEKEKYFEKYAKQQELDIAEMNLNYDNLIRIAKMQRSKDEKLNWMLSKVNFEELESNVELKLSFYKTLKSFLANSK